MCAHLGCMDDADGVDLSLPSCRAVAVSNGYSKGRRRGVKVLRVVSISAAFAIVNAGIV
jgi:hypothetical protein